jgi:AbiTii
VRLLVLQLQEDLVKGVKKTDELLRLAKLIAGKLQVDPLEHWISREITGYPRNETLPEYRVVLAGHLEVLNPALGYIPVSGARRMQVPQKASNEISLYLMQLCRPFIERDHNDASHGLFQLSQIFHGLGGMFVLRRYFPQFARR